MRVIRAHVLGFCMGVRRAVEMAGAELGRRERAVRTMGPLIHNPRVLSSLEDRGLRVLDGDSLPPELGAFTVILRAHGVSPSLEEELRRRNAVLADATCPRVKKNQLQAHSLREAGFSLFIAGEKRHGELIGLTGYAPGALVVSNPAEAALAASALARENPGARTALIGQTTIGDGEYQAIGSAIRAVFPGLKTVDSICPAARERQEALRELCSLVDAVLVAGGRASSNTRRLLDIALSLGKPAWLVESAGEIGALSAGIARYGTIGLSAGASTPDSDIAEIEAALSAL
ncbi:MAG: 4-hydroxy-3-methylbut-2-enyl diphosphate reductase [Treponema sp.]|jgi:4-hydroxy-3-methylbut-2-enyl diphosphate reductase|nr:4-hydroxy-3-methylbut-2-enyl diphosphate reductase [Treponema sp.]